MITALWIIGIHLLEILLIGGFLVLRRNGALERAVAEQQQYIDGISIVIEDSSSRLKELDTLGAFQADDEVGTFFTNLIEIQNLISQFNTRKK
jgi:uncharacterized coiled-coil protein SlyX